MLFKLCSTWICFACKSIWLYFIIWTLFLPFPILKFYAFKYDAIFCYHSILYYTTFVEAVVKFSCSKISDKLIRKGEQESSFFCGAALKTRWLTFCEIRSDWYRRRSNFRIWQRPIATERNMQTMFKPFSDLDRCWKR